MDITQADWDRPTKKVQQFNSCPFGCAVGGGGNYLQLTETRWMCRPVLVTMFTAGKAHSRTHPQPPSTPPTPSTHTHKHTDTHTETFVSFCFQCCSYWRRLFVNVPSAGVCPDSRAPVCLCVVQIYFEWTFNIDSTILCACLCVGSCKYVCRQGCVHGHFQ